MEKSIVFMCSLLIVAVTIAGCQPADNTVWVETQTYQAISVAPNLSSENAALGV
ncbi:MAG: hypothetical protein FWC70_04290 [Defluviitaleaceae bacterium]|nr:hypothetical protein [Defluviitaleaceae bacterium]